MENSNTTVTPVSILPNNGNLMISGSLMIPEKFLTQKQPKEKYYICEHCGKLVTETQRLEECGYGDNGLCDCDYCDYEYNTKSNMFDIVFNRIYYDYVEIPKQLYDMLSNKNMILNLKLYRAYKKGIEVVKHG